MSYTELDLQEIDEVLLRQSNETQNSIYEDLDRRLKELDKTLDQVDEVMAQMNRVRSMLFS